MHNTNPNGPSKLRTSIRLSLQFSFLYAVLSALVFSMAYLFTQYEVRDWVSDEMRGDAQTLAAIYEQGGQDALISRVDALAEVSFENARIFQLTDAEGTIISGNISAALDRPVPYFIAAQAIALDGTVHDEVEGYWMREDRIGLYTLIQGSGDHIIGEILEALSVALGFGYLAVVILGLIFGVRVGRLTEQRITAISSTLSDVSNGQLDARIPTDGSAGDDFSRVAFEINKMLGQTKRLLRSQEQITNDIAHDMRTPLQHLRQRLETLRSSTSVEPEDISASLEQTEEIIATFNSLLRIAQIEASDQKEHFESCDIAQVIADVVEIFEPSAEDQGIKLTADLPQGSLNVIGDRSLLTQMVSNLVENAIKHCPKGTKVSVSAQTRAGQFVMQVSDDGPGVKEEDATQVFQRFFRGEKSRSSAGNGLGLALVKAIADMHNAPVSLVDSAKGATFEVLFSQPPST